MLFSLLLREWPTRDFGNFIDHFDAYTSSGVSNVSFKAMARSLFGIDNFELGAALSELQQMKLTDEFPLPARIANLFTPINTNYQKDKVHPELVEDQNAPVWTMVQVQGQDRHVQDSGRRPAGRTENI